VLSIQVFESEMLFLKSVKTSKTAFDFYRSTFFFNVILLGWVLFKSGLTRNLGRRIGFQKGGGGGVTKF